MPSGGPTSERDFETVYAPFRATAERYPDNAMLAVP